MTDKPKNEPLKNDEQQRSFIRQNWYLLLLIALVIFVQMRHVILPGNTPEEASLTVLHFWTFFDGIWGYVILMLGLLAPVALFVSHIIPNRRPRFMGLFTVILLLINGAMLN